jgi:radical SAM superfamily enzyme YgiQ (UPF0313 family)
MKVMLATTPIRPIPVPFPPIGSLSIFNYLRENGNFDVEFYNIDANRPSYEEVLAHIEKAAPDVLGISAVVSTAYAYTKKLSLDVKKFLPNTLIVVGGSLAASAEILLHKTGTDLCVLGEGEKVFLNIVNQAEKSRSMDGFALIPGIMMKDEKGQLLNSGYEKALSRDEIYNVDWSVLEESSGMDIFLQAAEEGDSWLNTDPRPQEVHRQGKKIHHGIVGSKGCVARCTFCHRWDKGIRYIPPNLVLERIDDLIENHNVGFFNLGDENFGTDKKWLKEFCEGIKKRDIIWRVAGMRVNCISPESISMMKDAGCVSILYGMETGSERMLKVMEKKTTVEDNYKAMEWTVGANLWTGIQLVIGMPGENPETIRETIEFCKTSQTLSPNQSPNDLSVNYAQALPGTPLYEFARNKGLIGTDLDSEEQYLLNISDRDAHDELTTINFSDYPQLITRSWRPQITIEVNYHYVMKYGLEHYFKKLLVDKTYFKKKSKDTGYFANPKRLVDTSLMTSSIQDVREAEEIGDSMQPPALMSLLRKRKLGLTLICYPVLAYKLRHFIWIMVLLRSLQSSGLKATFGLLGECALFKVKQLFGAATYKHAYKSLRKVVNVDLGDRPSDTPEMSALRRGR